MEEKLTTDDVRDWGNRFSNRGRWGDDDRYGTLNFITRARVLDACALARIGQIISCALPFDEDGSPRHALGQNPVISENSAGGQTVGLDSARGTLHVPSQGCTQWDSRIRLFEEATTRVGRAATSATQSGAFTDSIDQLKNGVVGRGVLLDLPRFVRLPWLEDGTRVFPADLDACAEASGVTVQSGDIVLVRTGKLTHALAEGWESYANGTNPGLSVHCARWLHEREVAALASDTICVEVLPGEVDGCTLPLHRIAIQSMGLLLGETFQLDDLARVCAEDETYEFLFAAAPLPIPTGGSSPINPLAIR